MKIIKVLGTSVKQFLLFGGLGFLAGCGTPFEGAKSCGVTDQFYCIDYQAGYTEFSASSDCSGRVGTYQINVPCGTGSRIGYCSTTIGTITTIKHHYSGANAAVAENDCNVGFGTWTSLSL